MLVNKGMWHVEGGWPKDLDCTEPEQTGRFIRKVPLLVLSRVLLAILYGTAICVETQWMLAVVST